MVNASQLFKDDEEERVSGVPSDDELRHITGISSDEEGVMDREASNDSTEDIAAREGEASGDAPKTGSSPLSAGGLAAAEGAGAAASAFPVGYTPGDKESDRGQRIKTLLRANRKKVLIGGGAGGGIGAIILALFLIIIPLKIETMVTDLQNHFFGNSENAISNEGDSLLTSYIRTRVIPGYTHCGSTVDKNCSAIKRFGSNPVDRLFNDWKNNKLETKLATNYGIEFTHKPDSNTWFLKGPGTSAEGDPIGEGGKDLDSVFARADRAQMRQAVRDALQGESSWKQVYYRYSVGRLLEEKYGVRRCVIFCGVTDPLADSIANQKIAAKLALVDRVITPRDKVLGVALGCFLNPNCNPEKVDDSDSNPATNGAPISDTEATINENFAQLAASSGLQDAESVAALKATYTEISEKGFQTYAINKVLAPLLGDTSAQAVDKAIPVIGWIQLADQVETAAENIGPAVDKLGYLTNADAAVDEYATYRTYADEIHTGNVTATEVGSMTDSLGPGDSGSASDAEVGGTAGAEGSPLYDTLINGDSDGGDSTSAKTTTASADYKCNDGKGIPVGDQVCPEEVLGQGNGPLNSLHSFIASPAAEPLTLPFTIWRDSVGKVFGLFNWAIGGAVSIAGQAADATCVGPGLLQAVNPLGAYCEGKAAVEKVVPSIATAAVNEVIPNPFSTNMSGARTFDETAAGADVAGNDSAHTSLGGEALTQQQSAAIATAQETDAEQSFSHQPLFARMFSTNSPYSLVSKLALDMPSGGVSSMRTSFASLLSNPFGSLMRGFSSLFSSRVNAVAQPQADPFGVTQYGYPDGTIPSDPEAYWNQYCSDGADGKVTQAWNAAAANSKPDPNTGMQVNSSSSNPSGDPASQGTDPCLLISSTVGALGGAQDTSLLSPDDLADLTNGSQTNGTPPTGTTIDMANLYQDSTGVACASGTTDIGNYTGYTNGNQVPIKLCAIPNLPSIGDESNGGYGVTGANGDAVVNSRVSGAFLALVTAAKAAGIPMSADSTYRTMAHQIKLCDENTGCRDGTSYADVAKPGTSNHQMGLAVDFAMANTAKWPLATSACDYVSGRCEAPGDTVWEWLNSNSTQFGIKPYVNEFWHWSPTGN